MALKKEDLQALYVSGLSSNSFRPVLTMSLRAKYLAMLNSSSGERDGADEY